MARVTHASAMKSVERITGKFSMMLANSALSMWIRYKEDDCLKAKNGTPHPFHGLWMSDQARVHANGRLSVNDWQQTGNSIVHR